MPVFYTGPEWYNFDTSAMAGNPIDTYLKKLEEFEKKWGAAWVKSKYENPPAKDSQYYDFAMKMHSAYVYRSTGKEADLKVLQEALERKGKPKPVLHRGYNITPQLQASLSGFNGGRGRRMSSPQEFYDLWLQWKSSKAKNPSVRKVVEEAIEKKGDVLLIIADFMNARHKRVEEITKPQEVIVHQESLINKPKNVFQGIYEKVECEKCGAKCDGYYTLSMLTKGLWVKCKSCGSHARPFIEGLQLPWKPSKTYIKAVGKDEALRIAGEKEREYKS